MNSKKGILQLARRLAWLLGKEGLDRIPNCVKREQTNISVVLAEYASVSRLTYLSCETSGSRKRDGTKHELESDVSRIFCCDHIGWDQQFSIRLSCSADREGVGRAVHGKGGDSPFYS